MVGYSGRRWWALVGVAGVDGGQNGWCEIKKILTKSPNPDETRAGFGACESLFKISHTNWVLRKNPRAPEAAEPCFGPKWGRWVYEKAGSQCDCSATPPKNLKA